MVIGQRVARSFWKFKVCSIIELLCWLVVPGCFFNSWYIFTQHVSNMQLLNALLTFLFTKALLPLPFQAYYTVPFLSEFKDFVWKNLENTAKNAGRGRIQKKHSADCGGQTCHCKICELKFLRHPHHEYKFPH